MFVNPALLELAEWRLNDDKSAFVPPSGPPGAPGGAPGGMGDSSAGGAPPDPSMGGGAPPMDPSMGGAPPMAPPPAPAPMAPAAQAAPAAPAVAAPGAGKPNKDQQQQAMAMDMWQMKKYLFMMGEALGIKPPPSLLDGPNRDPNTGLPMAPGMPGSTSDPAVMQQEASNMQTQGGQGGDQQSSIPPIQGIQPAMPTPTTPGDKQSSADKADALLSIMNHIYTS